MGVMMFDPSNSAAIPKFSLSSDELHIRRIGKMPPPASLGIGGLCRTANSSSFLPLGKVVGDDRGYFVYTRRATMPRKANVPRPLFAARYSDDADALDGSGRAN